MINVSKAISHNFAFYSYTGAPAMLQLMVKSPSTRLIIICTKIA